MKYALAVLAVLVPAAAMAQAPANFPLTVSDQDTSNLRQICDFARSSSAINLETASAVTTYCVGLINRIAAAEANATKPKEAKPSEPGK
jgi:hypothetical protein